jgi:hypothetical protein
MSIAGALEGSAISIGRTPARPVAELGMGAKTTADELAQFLAVLVGQYALEALDDLAGQAGFVRARVVRVDDTDARPPQRVFVEGGFIGLEP